VSRRATDQNILSTTLMQTVCPRAIPTELLTSSIGSFL
jgi:hypothetical protein